jgi:16S rRNA (guanine966-N2)-methyltransferase
MRIVAGAWRGRALIAPAGQATRPTADRVRQALFDMLLHAPWGGRDLVEGARVLDAFAGTGAFGLEALSRGAAFVTFMEQDRAALKALHSNVTACRAEGRTATLAVDVLTAPAGEPCSVVFLDPPYGRDLVPRAVHRLRAMGWVAPGALLVVEGGRDEALPELGTLLAQRVHGAARVQVHVLCKAGEVCRDSLTFPGTAACASR